MSRYFPREYSESEVKGMINALDRFKERFRRWIS